MKTSSENFARLSCAIGGGIWGLYWIPLRAINEAGIPGAWATAIFHLIPALLLLPLIFFRFANIRSVGMPIHGISCCLGIAMMLYSTAFLYTDIIHAILLYYLMPLWGTILARAWLKEPISGDRVIGIILGLAGMLIILNTQDGFPLPRNAGDWMALSAGVMWALSANLLRRYPNYTALQITPLWFLWCSIFSIFLAILTYPDAGYETIKTTPEISLWLIPISIFLLMPGYFAVAWGTPKQNPGTSGVLFMTEISVGAISAALLTNEPFAARETVGIILITLAGLTEPLTRLAAGRRSQ